MVQVLPVQSPEKPAKTDDPTGVAVRVTLEPVGKLLTQFTCVLAQLIPPGELLTVPVPVPAKLSARVGSEPPLLLPVKQTTSAVMDPVTIAPVADTPPASLFVCTVAEMIVPPQGPPVTVIRPLELTVTMAGVFELQVTSSVISLVTGG